MSDEISNEETPGSGYAQPTVVLAATMAAFGVAITSTNALPMIVGSLVDGLSLSEASAGLLGSVELASIAITCIGLAPRMAQLSRARLALGGAVIAALAHFVSASLDNPWLIGSIRMLAGVGEGAALAAANATVAGAVDPDRFYAKITVLGAVAAAAVLASAPLIISRWSYHGAFWSLAIISTLMIPLLRRLPSAPVRQSDASTAPLPPRSLAFATLFAVLVINVGEGAVWAFTERIGSHIGLAIENIGIVLGLAGLLAMVGGAIALWLGTRFGRSGPLLVGIVAISLACLCLTNASASPLFVTGMLGWGFSLGFLLPYLMGTGAALDPLGRISAAIGGTQLIGAAIGPAIGGFCLTWSSYRVLGLFALACCALSALAIIPVSLRIDRGGYRPAA